jgi:hypothetical protein
MKIEVISATAVLADAIRDGKIKITGSVDRALEYFMVGAGGKSGFIVDGDLNRFAEYFLKYIGGGCGKLTETAANGGCGFVLKGDYQLAWSTKFLESGAGGKSGFIVQR